MDVVWYFWKREKHKGILCSLSMRVFYLSLTIWSILSQASHISDNAGETKNIRREISHLRSFTRFTEHTMDESYHILELGLMYVAPQL